MATGTHDAASRRRSPSVQPSTAPARSTSHLIFLIRDATWKLERYLTQLTDKHGLARSQDVSLRAAHASLTVLWDAVLSGPHEAVSWERPCTPCWHGIWCSRAACPFWHPQGRLRTMTPSANDEGRPLGTFNPCENVDAIPSGARGGMEAHADTRGHHAVGRPRAERSVGISRSGFGLAGHSGSIGPQRHTAASASATSCAPNNQYSFRVRCVRGQSGCRGKP